LRNCEWQRCWVSHRQLHQIIGNWQRMLNVVAYVYLLNSRK
jgi:hypothetical protein